MERLCINCKHYWRNEWEWHTDPERCHALDHKPHPVTGRSVAGIEPSVLRMTLCGWDDPKWWEPKDKP